MLAYADDFKMLGYLTLACIPLVLLKSPRHGTQSSHEIAAE